MHRLSNLHSTSIENSIRHSGIWLNLLALVLFVTSTNLLHAQSVGSGQIQETVTDQTGNAVAGARRMLQLFEPHESTQSGGTNVNGVIGNPGTALNTTTTFGTITAANQPRILQLSLKVNF
ncbi:MAG TPA: hypothetical protein VGM27_14860 [Acidobacteriaceae bacterium]